MSNYKGVIIEESLENKEKFFLFPTAPFHFDSTVFNPSHFPSKDLYWEPGKYWQTLRWQKENYGILMKNAGMVAKPKIEVTIFSRKKIAKGIAEEIANELSWRFDLKSKGVPEFIKKFKKDKHLGPVINRRPGMRPKSGYSLYEYLVITVMLQNTVVRRSVSMLQKLFESYGQLLSFDDKKLWVFWDPRGIHKTTEEKLRALKLGYRAKTLKRQAEQFVKGNINELELRKIQDKEIVAKSLDGIYGVGPQSAWYMLFEFFHFYDMLEDISLWESKIIGQVLFGKTTPSSKIHKFLTTRYKEFRQLAFYYLFTDIFWQHREKPIPWLKKEIRL